jgi:hypothetical protein
MRRKRTQSAYVRRKNAKKACAGYGGHDVQVIVHGDGAWFRCLGCQSTWLPGRRPFESGESRWQRLYGVSLT